MRLSLEKLFAVLGFILCCIGITAISAQSQQYVRHWTGNGITAMTSVTAANTASPVTITLTSPASEITIGATPGGSDVFVNFNGTATTSNFEIPAGYYFTFSGFPQMSSFSIIGDGTAGSHSVFAH